MPLKTGCIVGYRSAGRQATSLLCHYHNFKSIGCSNVKLHVCIDLNKRKCSAQGPYLYCPSHFDDFTGTPYLIPDDGILKKLNETELLKIYWRYINTIQTLCRNQSRFGALGDGGKEVCLDVDFKPSPPCLVYSFGSKFEFSFDLAANHFYGCEVHTFDPTEKLNGQYIPEEISFHFVGLDGQDYVTTEQWNMSTLQTIMVDLQHTGKILDIVKLDIEGSEWSAIQSIVDTGVYRQIKQLVFECHFGHMHADPKNPFWGNAHPSKQLRSLRLLYEHGFRIFMRERVGSRVELDVPPQDVIFIQNEISLINIAFSPDKQ